MAGGLLFRCVDCVRGCICFDCAERLELLETMQFLENSGDRANWETRFNYYPPGTYEYVRCPDCCSTQDLRKHQQHQHQQQ